MTDQPQTPVRRRFDLRDCVELIGLASLLAGVYLAWGLPIALIIFGLILLGPVLFSRFRQ